jgi:hypothetical protein
MGTTEGGDGCAGAHNSVIATVKEEIPAEEEEEEAEAEEEEEEEQEKETKAAAMESDSVAVIASTSTMAHDVGAEASSGGMMDCPSAVVDEARSSQQTLNDDEGNHVSGRRSKGTGVAGDSLQESPRDDDDHIFNRARDYRGFGDEDEHGSKRQRLQRHTPQQIHELES